MSEAGVALVAPLFSTRESVEQAVTAIFAARPALQLEVLRSTEEATDFLQLEMPQLCIVDLSAPGLDAQAILEACRKDPWLHGGGVIAVYDDAGLGREIEELQDLNLVIGLRDTSLARDLPVVLDVILANKRLLAHRGLGLGMMDHFSARFELNNEVLEARCHASLVCNFLFSSGRIDAQRKQRLQLGLVELLLNAIEHGNCGISFEEKSALLESGGDLQALVRERAQLDTVRDKRVVLEYSIDARAIRFHIGDEGAGFDWRARVDENAEIDLFGLSGRGIAMARDAFSQLRYNDCGNEVAFDLVFEHSDTPLRPRLLEGLETWRVEAGEQIIAEGDLSNTIYFIVRGDYEIIAKDQVLTILKPDDIFIGEMAFLLGGRRTAAVRARTAGELVPVSRRALVQAIRRYPHYGLFLARLLAQRLARRNIGQE